MTLAAPNPRKKSEFSLRLETAWDAMPLKASCICGFTLEGSAGEMREALREHRRVEHPDRPLYAKRPKKKAPPRRVDQTPADKAILVAIERNRRRKNGNGNGAVHTRTTTVDREGLRVLYVEEGLSVRQCAEKLNVARTTVDHALDVHGIPRRRQPSQTYADRIGRDELYALYVEEGMGLDAICTLHNVSNVTVANALRKHGIPTRKSGGMLRINQAQVEAALKLYEAGLSSTQISWLAWERWGYSSAESCQKALLRVFGAANATRGKHLSAHLAAATIPELNRDEALAILLAAETKEAE